MDKKKKEPLLSKKNTIYVILVIVLFLIFNLLLYFFVGLGLLPESMVIFVAFLLAFIVADFIKKKYL